MDTITIEIDSFNRLIIETAENGMTATVRHEQVAYEIDEWQTHGEWQISL